MAKPKAVKFQHRGNGADARRPSSSSSELASPRKDLRNGIVDEKKPEQSEYEKKKQTFITRTIWTLIMIGGFFGLLSLGHVAVIAIMVSLSPVKRHLPEGLSSTELGITSFSQPSMFV